MRKLTLRNVILGGLICVSAASVLRSSEGARFAPPEGIATVDISVVLNSLDEQKLRNTKLADYGKKLNADLEALNTDIKQSQTMITTMAAGPERKEALIKLAEKQMNLKAKKELYDALFNRQYMEDFVGLYDRINDGAIRFAKMNHYTMVIASDEHSQLPRDKNTGEISGNPNQIDQLIAMRRVLFVATEHDITQQLIDFMNNEFKTTGGTVPAPPAGSVGAPVLPVAAPPTAATPATGATPPAAPATPPTAPAGRP